MATSSHVTLAVTLMVGLAVTFTSAGRRCTGAVDEPRIRWPVQMFPNPRSAVPADQLACCRQNVSNVCDPNGLISEEAADQIDNAINDVYRDTRCECSDCNKIGREHGYVIRVALMEEMEDIDPEGEDNRMGELRDAHLYSYQLSMQWRMHGGCGENNAETMVIMYVKRQGIVFTMTRQGVSNKVRDEDIATITLALRHYFDNDDTVGDGLLEMIARYKLIFLDRKEEALQPSYRRTEG